eukprot:TRINITY_DN7085_c0_g1_i6.p1 TRINITY_DN7085_c0_g1~~TRINITY_DN7085_c0_g1_i6.p1  ORF type:complete len:418 (-),score=73.29 TRINITY_DN7085_c0_g1_i6:206-1459(-)
MNLKKRVTKLRSSTDSTSILIIDTNCFRTRCIESKEMPKIAKTFYIKKMENLEEDLARINEILEAKHQQLKESETENHKIKDTVEERNREIQVLKLNLTQEMEEKRKTYDNMKEMEREMHQAFDNAKATQEEIDRVVALNERLTQANRECIAKENETAEQCRQLNRELTDTSRELEALKQERAQQQKELEAVREARRTNQKEVERLSSANSKLQQETDTLNREIRELESKIGDTNKRLNDTLEIVEEKEQEITELHDKVFSMESNAVRLESANASLTKENEGLKALLDKSSPAQQRLSSSAKKRKQELGMSPSLEHSRIEEKFQMNQELDALRQHASLLETQNQSLQKELDHFVVIDEKVKSELNRKPVVKYIKSKNEEELSNSFSKSRSSGSPAKSSIPELSLFQSPISPYSRKAY